MTETGVVYIPYEDLRDNLKEMVDIEDFLDRVRAAESCFALDKLVDDPDPDVRLRVARQGYGSVKLSYDDETMVRAALAERGLAPKTLAFDENWLVRYKLAQSGYGWDKLVNDENSRVREVVNDTGAGLGYGGIEDWVRRQDNEHFVLPETPIAKQILNEWEFLNIETGHMLMPDVGGEEHELHGMMTYVADEGLCRAALEAGAESVGMFARETVPAPGTGASPRLGFLAIEDYEDLLAVSRGVLEEGTWELDTPAAAQRRLSFIEQPEEMDFLSWANRRTAGMQLEELEVKDLKYRQEEGGYYLAFAGGGTVEYQPFMTDDGIVWDWEVNVGGARFMGRAKSIGEALANAKANTAAARGVPVNKVIENEDRMPEQIRREAGVREGRDVPQGRNEQETTHEKAAQEAREMAAALNRREKQKTSKSRGAR